MFKGATELLISTKLMISGLSISVGAIIADIIAKYDLIIVKVSATVSVLTLIIIAVSHYCKMVRENRAAIEDTRLKELDMQQKIADKKQTDLENERLELENKRLRMELEMSKGGK